MLDDISVFMRGIMLGLTIAAPVGPIGLLCIRRTVERGFIAGFSTGLGAAIADGFFGGVAAFGVTAILDTLQGHVRELRLIGGIFLLAAAVHSLLKEPHEVASKRGEPHNILGAIGGALFLTITNPLTIMGGITVVAGFGGGLEHARAGTLTLGVFSGSLLWWLLLCGGIYMVRHRLTHRSVLWLNRCTGVVLGLLGIFALLTFFSLVPENLQGFLTDMLGK